MVSLFAPSVPSVSCFQLIVMQYTHPTEGCALSVCCHRDLPAKASAGESATVIQTDKLPADSSRERKQTEKNQDEPEVITHTDCLLAVFNRAVTM